MTRAVMTSVERRHYGASMDAGSVVGHGVVTLSVCHSAGRASVMTFGFGTRGEPLADHYEL